VACLRLVDNQFRLLYVAGVRRALDLGFEPFAEFQELEREYLSEELFPLFANRVMSAKRKDYAEFISGLGLEHSESPLFVFDLLDRTGGRTATDRYRLFLEPEIGADGAFRFRFFVAGQSRERHAASEGIWNKLEPGTDLKLRREPENKFSGTAVQICHGETSLGYVPDYFASEIIHPRLNENDDVQCKLVRVNPGAAPQERILVEVKGIWKMRQRPFQTGDFASIQREAAALV
jgi:hypothetical protein